MQKLFLITLLLLLCQTNRLLAQNDTLFAPLGIDWLEPIPANAPSFQFLINDKWGVMDNKAKIIIPIKYEAYKIEFTRRIDANSHFCLKKGEKWIYLDKFNKEEETF